MIGNPGDTPARLTLTGLSARKASGCEGRFRGSMSADDVVLPGGNGKRQV
jgi:hypothetical protein